MYYNLLKKVVEVFNVERADNILAIYKWQRKLPRMNICVRRQSFKTIVNPLRWFLVTGENPLGIYDYEFFLKTVEELHLPFMAIVNDEGVWFVDLGKNYNSALHKLGLFNSSVIVKVKDGILTYNYPIFGNKLLELYKNIDVSVNTLKHLNPLEYIVELIAVRVYEFPIGNLEAEARIQLHPEGFVFDGIFLKHQSYDGENRIDLKFLKEILKILKKLSKTFGEKTRLIFPEKVIYKSELLDKVETELIIPNCEKINCKGYKPMIGNKNTDLRLKEIEKFLRVINQDGQK